MRGLNSKTAANRRRAATFNKILSHLYEVKDERNDIMHPKDGKTKYYKESRARQVLSETVEFMEDYSDFLLPKERARILELTKNSGYTPKRWIRD